ncbi:hypothetical protein PVAP13_1NG321957 [Panicum virgatum]|uniref:Uncharacterized protein n=1 Tax=Panicum virgatum TaxID=38727 RepID=A0A8T0X3M4_PANVG|nr:hypothetical protein PVAP13_1NG321957 [Panicum virgatum]
MTKGAAGQPNPRRPFAPPSIPPALPPWLPGPQPTRRADGSQHCVPRRLTVARRILPRRLRLFPRRPWPPQLASVVAARPARLLLPSRHLPLFSSVRAPPQCGSVSPSAAWRGGRTPPTRRCGAAPLSLSDPCSLPRHLLRAAGRNPHVRHPLLRRDAEARAAGGSSRRLHPRPFPSGFIGTSAQLLLPSLLLRRNPSCGSGTPQLLGSGGARRAGAQSQSRSRHLRQAAQAHQGAVPHPILR